MTINITVEMITRCIFHTLFQFDKLRRLIRHINPDIRRNSFTLFGKPFDQARVFQRSHTDRIALIVDLAVDIIRLKL